MEKGTILYFGTTRKGSGHGATLLKGSFDSRDEMSEIERWIDGLNDREHSVREFVLASVAYMLSSIGEEGEARKYWPWDEAAFKPKDNKSDMIRGGALAAAAIDRKNMDIHK